VAAEVSVSAVGPTGSGYARVWPDGAAAPNATFLNYASGQSVTNTGTVALSSGGAVRLANASGASHYAVDLQGFYLDHPWATDPTFNGGQPRFTYRPESAEVRIVDTAPAPGGKLWVLGSLDDHEHAGTALGGRPTFIGRLLATGAWDGTFGTGGRVRADPVVPIEQELLPMPDGGIAAFRGEPSRQVILGSTWFILPSTLTVTRLTASGQPFVGFDGPGQNEPPGTRAVPSGSGPGVDAPHRVAVDAAGRLLVVNPAHRLLRLTATGEADPAFAGGSSVEGLDVVDVGVTTAGVVALTGDGALVPVSDTGVAGAAVDLPGAGTGVTGALDATADGGLIADAKLANSDVGFVKVGQKVAVKVHAYPFSRHGMVAGRIVSIGADAVPDERLGLVYPIRVELDRKDAARFTLRPGMLVTADVRTGSRSLMDYLVSPIEAARAVAGRER